MNRKKIILISSVIFGSLAIGLISSGLPVFGQKTYDEKLKSLYNNTVPLIHPQQLSKFEKSGQPVIILDTRSLEEFSVSHLPNARFINYDEFEIADVNTIDKKSRVVVYCSVGYRSERIGEQLQKAGFSDVYNLYGGIFQWKNEGYSIVNNSDQPTDSVHTYNARWSKWLEKGIKVY